MGARKAFNVTLIRPSGYVHTDALAEAAKYLHWALAACGRPAVLTTNQFAPNAVNLVLCAHVLDPATLTRIPPDSIVFNSEQLDDPDSWNSAHEPYRQLLQRCFVWDYSQTNLALIPHGRKAVVPFGYCEALKHPTSERVPGETLLFYGAESARRRDLVRDLEAAGIPVTWLFGEYGAARDAHMLRCWAVLNLHKRDNSTTFEPIRCFHPLINDVPVISESDGDATAAQFRNCLYFFDRSALVEGVRRLYSNRAEFLRNSHAMLAEFRSRSPLPGVVAAVEAFERGGA